MIRNMVAVGAATAACLLVGASAHAQLIVDTSASLGHLRYTLEDLDVSDGITPNIVVSGSGLGAYFSQGAGFDDFSVLGRLKGGGVGVGLLDATSSVSLNNARRDAAASIDQGVLSTRSLLRGEGAAVDFDGNGSENVYSQLIHGIPSDFLGFYSVDAGSNAVLGTDPGAGTGPASAPVAPLQISLTPNTRLVLQADAAVDLTQDPRGVEVMLDDLAVRLNAVGVGLYHPLSFYTLFNASSQAELTLSAEAGGLVSQDRLSLSLADLAAGQSSTSQRTLQLVYDNLSKASAPLRLNLKLSSDSLYVYSGTVAGIKGTTASVPEVSALHMMVMGALGLLWVSSKRKPMPKAAF